VLAEIEGEGRVQWDFLVRLKSLKCEKTEHLCIRRRAPRNFKNLDTAIKSSQKGRVFEAVRSGAVSERAFRENGSVPMRFLSH